MKHRWLPLLAIAIPAILLSAPNPTEAKTYKQCVKGVTGIGYVAKVKWYDASKIKFTKDKIDLPKASKTKNVAVWEEECHSSSKPHFMTIEAKGNDAASTVVGVAVGITAGVAGIGLCAGVFVATAGAASGVMAPCVEIAIGGGTLAGEEVYAALPDPGIFFQGFAEKVEIKGTVWKPKYEITKRLKGIREPNEIVASCFGVKDAGTKDTITIEFFEGKNSLGKTTQVGCKNATGLPTKDNSIERWSRSTSKMTRFTIETSGTDALWLDYVILNGQWSGKIAQWGRAKGMGWCLSRDASDAKSWVKLKKVDKTCYRKYKFDVSTQKAYGIH